MDLLLLDEAARIDDELYTAVRPMIAVSGGRLLLLSSPFGRRGFFYRTWELGGPEWTRVRIRSDQCPRILPTFLEQERESMADWEYRSEYLAEFTETTGLGAFEMGDVERAITGVEKWEL